MGSGCWPQFYEEKPRERILAVFVKGKIRDETGVEYTPDDYAGLRRYLTDHNLDCYVTSLTSQTPIGVLLDLAADQGDTVCLTHLGRVVGISIRMGRKVRWIGIAGSWADEKEANPAFLKRLRAFFDAVGVGTYTTESATGQAMQRKVLARYDKPRFTRPSAAMRFDVLHGTVGGRVDTFVQREDFFAELYEIDLRNAYATMSRCLPNGSAIMIVNPCDELLNEKRYSTYYGRFKVTITQGAKIGPLHYKVGITTLHPGEAGEVWEAWYWKEEVEEARKLGWKLEPVGHRAWGWTTMSLILLPWATEVDALRERVSDAQVKDKVKQMIVSCLGCQGMQPYTYSLVKEEDAVATDTPVNFKNTKNPWSGYSMRATYKNNANHMVHWYSYIVMKCRLTLYRRMVDEEKQGNTVVASNYDAIYLEQPALLEVNGEMGGWKEEVLHHANIPAPRAVDSVEKVRRPGVPKGG